jgi:hypothetical protein
MAVGNCRVSVWNGGTSGGGSVGGGMVSVDTAQAAIKNRSGKKVEKEYHFFIASP